MFRLNRRFGPWSFYREALAVALPVMLQQFIMSMVSLVDSFMVAGLGDVSMAAVNVVNHFFFVFFVIINVICLAGGIYIAQFRGANDSEGMKHAFRFKVIFVFALAFLAFFLFRNFSRPLLALMAMGNAAQEEIVDVGSVFLRLIAWTFFPTAISLSIATSYREIAQPRIPLVISVIATFLNTFGNWVLIYGNLGAPRLEVRGSAYATIIARSFEVTALIIYAARTKAPFFPGFTRLFNVSVKLIREILVKSGMIFVSEFSFVSSETIMVAMYNRRGGAEVVAGMAAGWTIANIFFLLFGGIQITATVLIGGSLGANKLDQARSRTEWLKTGSVAAGIIMAIPGAALVFMIIPVVFSHLSAAARANCLGLVLVVLAYLPIWGLLNVQYAISRAGGDTAMGMYTDLIANTFLFAPAAFTLSFLTTIAPVPMFALLKITDIVKVFICRYFLRKERWVRNLAVR